MRFPGFIGATYAVRSVKADGQRCLNLFPEIVESQAAPNGEIGYLLQVPGLRTLASGIGSGPVRASYTTSTGILAVVVGGKLYHVSSSWVAGESGSLLTTEGPVDMADNGRQLMLVDGSYGYVVSLLTGAFQRIESEYFYGATRVSFVDGYFLVNNPGTGQFQISALYDGITWDGLDFGVAEGLPDPVVATVVNNRQAWVLGTKSVEVYWNSGDDDFPFSRVDGSFIEHGCGAAFTAQKFAGTLAWVSDKGQVLMANGYQPQRISNHSVELAIRQAGDYSAATAFTHSVDGHAFYCLQLPGAETTWCYDLTTSQWHERAELVAGRYAPSRVSCATYAYGIWVAGDAETGTLYHLDPDTYDNAGAPLAWERTAPHLVEDGRRAFLAKFTLDMETGVGLDGTQQGTDPQVMLQISRDGGHTFGPERWVSAGSIGAFRHRAKWSRLGSGRDLVVKVRGTDPVKTIILGASIDVQLGVG